MAGGFKLSLVPDVAPFVAGMAKAEKSLDETADAVDDLARTAQTQARAAGQDIAKGIDSGTDKATRSTADLEVSFREMAQAGSKAAKSAGDDIGRDIKRGTDEASEGTDTLKENAGANAKEVAASFDGSIESIAEGFQGLAAEALEGFGAFGLAAGVGVAAGVGIGIQALNSMAEAANKVTDDAIALNDAFQGAGDTAARVQVLQDRWTEFGNAINDVRSVWEVWQDRAVTNMEQFAKSARLAGLDVDALFSGFTDPDPVRRLEQLNKALEQQQDTLKEINRVGDSADPKNAQRKQEERLAIDGTVKALREEIAVSQAAIELDKSRAAVAGVSVQKWHDQQAATEALAEATDAYNATLQDSADAVSVYSDLLSDKTEVMKQKAQEHAESTKESTGQAADSWEDYAEDVTVSVQDLIDTWNKQAEQAKAFESNLATIAAAGGQALADELRAKGPEVAGAVADTIAKAGPDEQRKAIAAHATASGEAVGRAMASGLTSQQQVFSDAVDGFVKGMPVPALTVPVNADLTNARRQIKQLTDGSYSVTINGKATGVKYF